MFLFEELRKIKLKKWATSRIKIIKKLEKMPNFYVEIKWKCKSTIPLVSRFTPSDTFKIWKIGS